MKTSRAFRVAMIAACPFPSLRGSQVLVREVAEGLAQAGHAVHVVTYPTAQHIVPVERISIHRVPKLPGLWTARPFGWQKLVLDLLLGWLLFRVVRRERIDVVHAHNAEAPLIAFLVRWFTRVPVVYHAHNALSDELPCYFHSKHLRRVAARLGGWLDRRLAARADYTIALSDRLAAYLAVRGAAGRVMTISPAVGKIACGEPAGRAGDGPMVMYGGNLDPYQNLGCLLEAFDRLRALEPRVRLTIVTHRGAHSATDARAAMLAEHPGVSVRTVNSFGAALRELAAADVLVCPRTSWSGFPIKVLNYMAMGRPIVQARASAHVIEDGVTGLLFDDDDGGSLAKTIVRLVRDPELAGRLARQARGVARERYGWPRALAGMQAVYERVTGRVPDRGDARRGGTGAGVEQVMRSATERIGTRGPLHRERSRPHALKLVVCGLLAAIAVGCAVKPTEAPLPPVAQPLSPDLADTGQYRLEPGDVLRIKFVYHPELDVKLQIDPDGNISIPGVGELQARGKTADELASEIEVVSSEHLREPKVAVIVAELGPRKVYVGGEVRLPGPVPYRVGMTPMQAILDRGGFTEVARIDSVLHVTSKGNSVEATRLDFSSEIEKGTPELTTLAVNDVIYVPRTFIGDANAFVRLYIRGLLPTMPRMGVGLNP